MAVKQVGRLFFSGRIGLLAEEALFNACFEKTKAFFFSRKLIKFFKHSNWNLLVAKTENYKYFFNSY